MNFPAFFLEMELLLTMETYPQIHFGVKEQSTETATLGVQVMGILSGLRGLGRDVDQTSKTPSGQLLFTDQLPTEIPCGSKMICRSRMFYPKCFPTPLLGAGSLTDTSFVNCMCPPQAF